ncbi:MAG: EF-P beta-lysylation protein EpmB [Chlamydiae bacterium RIFCSPLOWO2_02_FULL_49_12]|nr:MAG: EF-P beta-lysylation protein EpmB [Chlamydiae bacterium RIFCSPLOWO2_02_FULL_49_12]
MSSSDSWLKIRRQNITDWHALCALLELTSTQRKRVLEKSRFPLNLPLRLAKKIAKKSLRDPLLRQFVPLVEEEREAEGFVRDPLEEARFLQAPKLLSKYRSRMLLLATPLCAMHCRYCFRRHFPYEKGRISYQKELDALARDPLAREVVLSGGDPLSLSNRALEQLVIQIEKIEHVERLRLHTRLPIGIPERMDDGLLSIFEKRRLKMILVLHANHPKELDEDLFEALLKLRRKGVLLLHQAVLLKGVNDDFQTLKELFESLINGGVIPYYLHQLDPVEGASHFYVREKRGKALISRLLAHLPGYAVPRYVKELAGKSHKSLI